MATMANTSKHDTTTQARRERYTSYRAQADAQRNLGERLADVLTAKLGSVTFLILNAIWFAIWMIINTGIIPGIKAFDPFPFGLLTMVVSLEAIFLAIIVLVSQNRAARVAEIREETDLQVNSIAEGEITKVIHLMTILMKKNGIKIDDDPELVEMLKPLNNEDLEKNLEKQLK